MALTTITFLEKIKAMIEANAESVAGMESIIGLAVLVGGIIVAGWQTVISMCAILSSYNIEIALMTKKERVKVNVTSMLIYIIALLILNLFCSHIAVAYEANKGIVMGGILLIFAFAVTLMLVIILLLGAWFIQKTSYIRMCRFIGHVLKKLLFLLCFGIYWMTGGLRRICRKVVNRLKSWRISKGIYRCYTGCREWLLSVWKSSEKDAGKKANHKLSFSQQLRLAGFALTTMLGVILNYTLAVYAKGNQNVYLLSIMVTILMIEVGQPFLNFRVTPEDSRIYYYDDILEKNIFIYFRQDENHCIGGDANTLGECNELFLVSNDKIEKHKLYSISKWERGCVNIDNKRIRLQHEQNEFIMSDVFDKIKNDLQSKEVALELIERTDFYVKTEEKKIYYVLPDGTTGNINL